MNQPPSEGPPAQNPYHHFTEKVEANGANGPDLGAVRLYHEAIERLVELSLDDVRHHPYQEMIPASLKSSLFLLAQSVEQLGKALK